MTVGMKDRRAWIMAALGFASGLPLMLTLTTLRQWLVERGAAVEIIGLTANIGLAYTFKFLWSPMLDHVPAPLGLARFGRRRGWMLAMQPILVLAILAMAASQSPLHAIAAAGLIALASATQDIAIDAWRIETFSDNEQGFATAIYVWGYRLAMLAASGGVLALASPLGWPLALSAIAALMALCILPTLLASEPTLPPGIELGDGGLAARARRALFLPLAEFVRRPGAALVLGYVVLFNLGEAMAGTMLVPLYRALGFSRDIVAGTAPFSLVGTLTGLAAGGWIVSRIGLRRALVTTGFAQMAAMAMYIALAGMPGRTDMLYATVLFEAFVQGVALASFLAYLSSLCAIEFTATQYALLTSLAAVASHTIGGFSGFLAASTGWQEFYTLAMLASLPAMLLMLAILKRFPAAGEP